MNGNFINYDALVQTSLMSVVKKVLGLAQERGVPSGHMIYISFCTKHKDVIIPDYLRKEYPEEMTIILENQFWNLTVADSYFKVDLYFNNIETILVPFAAVQKFWDPLIKFGIKFEYDTITEQKSSLDNELFETATKSPNNDKKTDSKPPKKETDIKEKKVSVIDINEFRSKKKPDL